VLEELIVASSAILIVSFVVGAWAYFRTRRKSANSD